MARCIFPDCSNRAKLICICCYVDWCEEHINNHYEAMKFSKRKYKCCAEHG